jgi:hypothetical protein
VNAICTSIVCVDANIDTVVVVVVVVDDDIRIIHRSYHMMNNIFSYCVSTLGSLIYKSTHTHTHTHNHSRAPKPSKHVSSIFVCIVLVANLSSSYSPLVFVLFYDLVSSLYICVCVFVQTFLSISPSFFLLPTKKCPFSSFLLLPTSTIVFIAFNHHIGFCLLPFAANVSTHTHIHTYTYLDLD